MTTPILHKFQPLHGVTTWLQTFAVPHKGWSNTSFIKPKSCIALVYSEPYEKSISKRNGIENHGLLNAKNTFGLKGSWLNSALPSADQLFAKSQPFRRYDADKPANHCSLRQLLLHYLNVASLAQKDTRSHIKSSFMGSYLPGTEVFFSFLIVTLKDF